MHPEVNLIRFAFIYVSVLIGTFVLGAAVLIAADIDISSGTQFLPIIAATLDAGHWYFKKYQSLPDSGFAWSAAFKMTIVEIIVFVPVAFVVILLATEIDFFSGFYIAIFLGVLAVVFLVSFLFKRFLFMSAAKGAQKAFLKRNAKASTVG
ncbi:ABZJ_00895 family protein [Roseibium sp. MB-4]